MMKRAIEAFQNGLDAVCDEKWFRLYGNGLCILALAVAKYGADFTWRQVLVGLLVVGIWNSGSELLHHDEKKRRFQRVQFRIGLTHFGQALVDAGIYSEDEVKQNSSALWDSLGTYSSGYITFAWLQQDLFFMNAASAFSESAELTISLKPFGRRAEEIGNPLRRLPDCIELRDRGDAYELVLIKSENRRGWIDPEGSAVTLMKLPYAFFRSLQGPPKWNIRKILENEKRQNEILQSAGLTRWQDSEVLSAWDYKGQYADLHWWTF
jgi:hypothetical protein